VDDLLLNEETGFRWVDNDTIDVDYEEDFLRYSSEMSSGIERFNPRAFEIDFGPFLRHFERYFQSIKLLGKVGRNKVWLDCACGSGYGTTFLTNFASEVWGYDIDKSAIVHADHHYKNPHCKFTADTKVLDKQKFDVIFSIETIEHMPLDEAAVFLRKCCELLRDDGNLMITTPIVPETNLNPSNEFHFFECSLDDFVSLLNENGFTVLDKILKTTTFTDGETKEQGYFKCQKLH
jgi:2-polyprenyl-3-methyl-5-hydroxy-6-metoxy-1,4-benzoquinol methylase